MSLKKERQAGQSTVEFALVLILLLSFSMFFLRLGLIFGFSNYVQYATFMSARAYLSAGSTPDEQIANAQEIILATVKNKGNGTDRYPWVAKGFEGSDIKGFQINHPRYDPANFDTVWMQGVRYRFKSQLFLLPFAGLTPKGDAANQLTLTSESWLGREPSYQECSEEMGAKKGIIDNGC